MYVLEDGTIASGDCPPQSHVGNLINRLQMLEKSLLDRESHLEAMGIKSAINILTQMAFDTTPPQDAKERIANALAERFIARSAVRVTGPSPYRSLSAMPKSYSDDFYKDADAVMIAMGAIIVTPIEPAKD